ncbi:MAG: hypothetical protein ABJH04_07495 [Cyclobacteriaceae bacterium]
MKANKLLLSLYSVSAVFFFGFVLSGTPSIKQEELHQEMRGDSIMIVRELALEIHDHYFERYIDTVYVLPAPDEKGEFDRLTY